MTERSDLDERLRAYLDAIAATPHTIGGTRRPAQRRGLLASAIIGAAVLTLMAAILLVATIRHEREPGGVAQGGVTTPGMPSKNSSGVADLSFVDALHGVALRYTCATSPAMRLLATADGGRTWSTRTTPPGLACSSGTLSGPWLAFATPDVGWLATNASASAAAGGHPTFYATHDGGRTWQPEPYPGGASIVGLAAADGTVWTADATCPTPPRGRACSSTLYVSHDLGRKWSAVTTAAALTGAAPGQEATIAHLDPRDAENIVVVSFLNGLATQLSVSHDAGRTWRHTTNPCPVHDPQPQSRTIDTRPAGEGTTIWVACLIDVTPTTYIDPVQLRLFYSSDSGDTWHSATKSLPAQTEVTSFAALSPSTAVVAASDLVGPGAPRRQRVLLTTDFGSTWLTVEDTSQGPTYGGQPPPSVVAMRGSTSWIVEPSGLVGTIGSDHPGHTGQLP